MTELEILSKKLKYRLSLPLPGLEAQLRMAHADRRRNMIHYKIPDDAKIGAVLILLFEDEQKIKTVLIQRPQYEGVHGGQVAFPGGKIEPDETLDQAALREAEEEVGVISKDIKLLGKLTELFIPPSNFLVHPFVGSIEYKPGFQPQQEEVEGIIEVNLDYLLDESRISEKEIILSSGLQLRTPYYDLNGKTVWGATAMMISEFAQILREL
jgi:8-oxo-dGTP pyrophosphatase MutT (NUDIX family)